MTDSRDQKIVSKDDCIFGFTCQNVLTIEGRKFLGWTFQESEGILKSEKKSKVHTKPRKTNYK